MVINADLVQLIEHDVKCVECGKMLKEQKKMMSSFSYRASSIIVRCVCSIRARGSPSSSSSSLCWPHRSSPLSEKRERSHHKLEFSFEKLLYFVQVVAEVVNVGYHTIRQGTLLFKAMMSCRTKNRCTSTIQNHMIPSRLPLTQCRISLTRV